MTVLGCRRSSVFIRLWGLHRMQLAAEQALQLDPVLAEMVRRLRDAFNPDAIYLFGSHARGSAGPDSDYDLLMIVAGSALPRYRREQAAFQTLSGVGASKDVLVLTREEFDCGQRVVCSLPATVGREGILLYGD